MRCELPKLDVPLNQISWEVYLPDDYSYSKFGGNVKKHVEPPPPKPAQWQQKAINYEAAGRKVTQAQKYSIAATPPPSVEETSVKGVLPVQIEVPEKGEKLQFTKLLVTEDAPYLTFRYKKKRFRFLGLF